MFAKKYSAALTVINSNVLSAEEMSILDAAITDIAEIQNISRTTVIQKLHSEALRLEMITAQIRDEILDGKLY